MRPPLTPASDLVTLLRRTDTTGGTDMGLRDGRPVAAVSGVRGRGCRRPAIALVEKPPPGVPIFCGPPPARSRTNCPAPTPLARLIIEA